MIYLTSQKRLIEYSKAHHDIVCKWLQKSFITDLEKKKKFKSMKNYLTNKKSKKKLNKKRNKRKKKKDSNTIFLKV